MVKMVGTLIVLVFLFSACGVPAVIQPIEQVQHTQTSIPIVTLTSSPGPTSTLDESNKQTRELYGVTRFCQVSPESAKTGSTINISAFELPPNQSVSVYIFNHHTGSNTFVTDNNGYLNIDILVPMDANPGWNMVVVEGMSVSMDCLVWLWSEEYSPTYYASLTKTVTPTLSPNQIIMTATHQALKDRLGANCTYGSAQQIEVSPRGRWAEAVCAPDSIIVIRMDGTKEWSLSSDSLIGPYTDHFVNVAHWSNDGKYVYVSVNPHTDGYWEPFHQGFALYRLNLESGQIGETLPLDENDWKYYSLSFSPNDSWLAYIMTDQSPVILNIRDVQTGIDQSIEFDPKYNSGGGFVWSPDGQKLVFSITQYDPNIPGLVATSVIMWDSETSNITTLIKDNEEVLVPVEWVDETKIVLQALYENDTKIEVDVP